MKRVILGMVAAFVLTGCGHGKATATTSTTSTTTSPTTATTTTTSTTTTSTTATTTTRVSTTTATVTTEAPATAASVQEAPQSQIVHTESAGFYQPVFMDVANLAGKSDIEAFTIPLRIEFNRYIAKYIARDISVMRYALYDINGDGVDELFVGSYGEFYTIYGLNNGAPYLIAQNFVPDFGNERNFSTVYQDGRILENNYNSGSGDGRATLLQLSGGTVYEVDAVDYQALQFDESDLGLAGVPQLDIASLSWQSFE